MTPESPKDPIDALSGWTGRAASAPRASEPWLTRRQRIALMSLVVAGHAGLGLMLDLGSRVARETDEALRTTLVFLSPPEPEPKPRPADTAPAPIPESTPLAPVRRPSPARPASTGATAAAPTTALQVVELPSAPETLQLYRADGSIELPDEVKDQLEGVLDPGRAFSFQYPGLVEGGTFMDRQPALVYEETRFEQYWKPQQDVLTEFLERAVEATTQTIEIPVPGDPGAKIVCKVAILAAGGACGVVRNNDGYVVDPDDPNTLDPEEEKQCAAWWDQIVSATGQEAWRRTRDLYERSCRKPPAKPALGSG